MEQVTCYKVSNKYYENIKEEINAEKEQKLMELFKGKTIAQVVEDLAANNETVERMLEIVSGKIE
jgi:hypothetical protein